VDEASVFVVFSRIDGARAGGHRLRAHREARRDFPSPAVITRWAAKTSPRSVRELQLPLENVILRGMASAGS
jgi:hypothetical protein